MSLEIVHSDSLKETIESLKDQYADGKAAELWDVFIGDTKARMQNYKNFLVSLLKKNGCRRILDLACGNGVDSIMLLEEGFEVVSVDASDKMLKYAKQTRWNRRDEPAFFNWTIEEGNWLTLYEDIKEHVGEGFDAAVSLGNSFAMILDSYGDQREHKQALKNFEKVLKPGGLLLIDHRNYDYILNSGRAHAPSSSIYYSSEHLKDIKTVVVCIGGKPTVVVRDYFLVNTGKGDGTSTIRFTLYPHTLENFKSMLKEVFGKRANYTLFGDFKSLEENSDPVYYIHMVEKEI